MSLRPASRSRKTTRPALLRNQATPCTDPPPAPESALKPAHTGQNSGSTGFSAPSLTIKPPARHQRYTAAYSGFNPPMVNFARPTISLHTRFRARSASSVETPPTQADFPEAAVVNPGTRSRGLLPAPSARILGFGTVEESGSTSCKTQWCGIFQADPCIRCARSNTWFFDS